MRHFDLHGNKSCYVCSGSYLRDCVSFVHNCTVLIKGPQATYNQSRNWTLERNQNSFTIITMTKAGHHKVLTIPELEASCSVDRYTTVVCNGNDAG